MKKQADILTQYAKIDEAHVDALLQEELRRNRKKLVVLDDDPTGVQTVHDVSVYFGGVNDKSSPVFRRGHRQGGKGGR